MRSSAVSWAITALAALMGTGLVQTLAAVEPGTLTIQSQPDVEVIWDDVPLGATDASGQMSIGNIPPGTYTLTFTSPGFNTRIDSVDVAPGLQHLGARLVEAEPTEASEPAPPIEASEPEPPFEAAGPVPAGEGGGDPQDHIATTTFLVVTAVLVLTAFLLADRRSRRRQAEAKPEGPRIVVQGTSERPKKLPTFYDDLKRRETDLEDLVDAGSGRSHRQVIDIEIEDHGPVEDDK